MNCRALLSFVSALVLVSEAAWAVENVVSSESAQKGEYVWELAIAEIYLQSQEVMDQFFQPSSAKSIIYPAVGKLIEAERNLSGRWNVRTALMFPIRHESIVDRTTGTEKIHFAFTKAFGLGFGHDLVLHTFESLEGEFIISPNLGILHPMEYGGADVNMLPQAGLKFKVNSLRGGGLGTEFGYVGDFKSSGTFYLRLGATFRI